MRHSVRALTMLAAFSAAYSGGSSGGSLFQAPPHKVKIEFEKEEVDYIKNLADQLNGTVPSEFEFVPISDKPVLEGEFEFYIHEYITLDKKLVLKGLQTRSATEEEPDPPIVAVELLVADNIKLNIPALGFIRHCRDTLETDDIVLYGKTSCT